MLALLLEVWDYCYGSASALFGIATGDPIVDRIREAVEASPSGLSQYQIRRLFHGHIDTPRIEAALQTLVTVGALSARTQPTGGRPTTLWSPLLDNTNPEREGKAKKDAQQQEAACVDQS